MNRIITILVTIFILLLLYIWISHVWGSDSPRRPRQIVQTTQDETLGADDSTADADTSLLSDNLTDDLLEDDATDEMTDSEPEPIASKQEEVIVEEPKKPEVKKQPVVEEKKPVVTKTESKPKPKTTAPATPPATKTSQPIPPTTHITASTGGKHLVIAGNFLQRENANQRMQELKKAGFGDVEVVNFDLSEYHTVSVGRFDDVNEARRLVKKLKDYHKIDAYVRIGS